jgi:hypothetical protein
MARTFPLFLLGTLFLLGALAACTAHMSEPQNFVVYFHTGEAQLTPEGQQVVTAIATAQAAAKPRRIQVEGRADGGTPHDAALADDRAIVVIGALVRSGIDATAIDKRPSAPPEGVTGVAAHEVVVRFVP